MFAFLNVWVWDVFRKNFTDLCVLLFQSSCLLFVGFVTMHFIRGYFKLMLYLPVNNCSVMSGQFSGLNKY